MDFCLMLAGPGRGKTALSRLLLDTVALAPGGRDDQTAASVVGPSTSSLSSFRHNSHEAKPSLSGHSQTNDDTITGAESLGGRGKEGGASEAGVLGGAETGPDAPSAGPPTSGREDANGNEVIATTKIGEDETVDRKRDADADDREVRAAFPPNGALGPGTSGLGERTAQADYDPESEQEEREWVRRDRQRAYEDARSIARFVSNAEKEGKTRGIRKCSVEVYAPSSSTSSASSPTSTTVNSKDVGRPRVRLTLVDTPSLSVSSSSKDAGGMGMDLDPGEVAEEDLARLERTLAPVLEFVEERFVESLEDVSSYFQSSAPFHCTPYLAFIFPTSAKC